MTDNNAREVIAPEDRIERLTHPFYIRWTRGPNYERAYLCVEDGEPDMRDFASVSFGQAALFAAGVAALPADERLREAVTALETGQRTAEDAPGSRIQTLSAAIDLALAILKGVPHAD